MKRMICALCAVLLLFSVQVTLGEPLPADAELERLIVGAWLLKIDLGVMKIESVETYSKDKRAMSKGILTTKDGKEIEVRVEGPWSIKNGVLTTTVDKTNVPKLAAVGEVAEYEIVELTDKVFKVKSENIGLMEMTRKE
jgi:hypothetical protein